MSGTQFLLGLVIILLTVLVPYIIKFLRAKTKEVLESLSGTVTDDNKPAIDVLVLMDKVADMVFDVVEAGNQTIVDTLKKTGKFDKEAQEKIKDEAIAKVKETLTATAVEILEEVVDDLDLWLDSLVESSVRQSKLLSAS